MPPFHGALTVQVQCFFYYQVIELIDKQTDRQTEGDGGKRE
jgi:hypothetical protein